MVPEPPSNTTIIWLVYLLRHLGGPCIPRHWCSLRHHRLLNRHSLHLELQPRWRTSWMTSMLHWRNIHIVKNDHHTLTASRGVVVIGACSLTPKDRRHVRGPATPPHKDLPNCHRRARNAVPKSAQTAVPTTPPPTLPQRHRWLMLPVPTCVVECRHARGSMQLFCSFGDSFDMPLGVQMNKKNWVGYLLYLSPLCLQSRVVHSPKSCADELTRRMRSCCDNLLQLCSCSLIW